MIRALLVDDEPPARTRMRQLLEAIGDVRVVGEAGNAAEALDLIRAHRPDVLFLDVDMPEVRGTALAAALPQPRPFIVFATAYERYAIEAIDLDATGYLLKPVTRVKLAETLARVRLRMSRLSDLERDVAAASALQTRMWPASLPSVPGFDCAAASLPARGVGGDFYDLFALDSGTWAMLLGDASGKGVAAGLVASAVQARVHTAARLARLDPVSLMAAIDQDMYASIEGARYATAVYATLAPTARQLSLVNAGHLPVFVADTAGAIASLGSSGPALGLTDLDDGKPGGPPAYVTHEVELRPGDTLVAYTDGVTEARDHDGEEFGEERLAAFIRGHHRAAPAELCAEILDTIRRHRGERQDQDDVTVMVVRAQ